MLETVERETGRDPRWSVVWLHGLGADGNDFVPILPELVRRDWPAIRFVFPHAPQRAVTINGGMRMRAWYDIVEADLRNRADMAGVRESAAQVEALLAREIERGIPASHILLAGFSQGGAVALSAGLAREEPLAGLVALSTYVPGLGGPDAPQPTPAARAQPVFMAHGSFDPVVPVFAGQASAQALQADGMRIEWRAYPMAHQVCAEEIRDLGDWMAARFAAG
ncbi:alpha/beta hydrolase [Pseudoluteimonas lycopersici]|uniref:Alpha/beta hydrolase n=1 Tax=Pseudoluteimonas lycopersici TaxID=1324796 RepID=A0A516V8G7_9GAMM|nr:alpha/beta hydrolase [Lysobacter lycopersici]QDQ74832.1 alpha/beta hydrolase [Lysobacter lycopersici]